MKYFRIGIAIFVLMVIGTGVGMYYVEVSEIEAIPKTDEERKSRLLFLGYKKNGTPVKLVDPPPAEVKKTPKKEEAEKEEEFVAKQEMPEKEAWVAPKDKKTEEIEKDQKEERPEGSIGSEALVSLRSQAEMEAFIKAAERLGAEVIGTIPALNSVRLKFSDPAQEEALRNYFPGMDNSSEFNYVVVSPEVPRPPPPEDPRQYRAFNDGALEWLGVPEENSQWGTGITVAVLDTGVTEHATFGESEIANIDILGEYAADPESEGYDGHGTAVASIIAGTDDKAPGIAPGAEIMSIRVLNEDGVGDSFSLAQGIVEAVDRGAQVINMSLGSYGDNEVLRSAIEYATSKNVALVAAAGNDGAYGITYPARYPEVIGVSAVDANGQRTAFSNYGDGIDFAAPGVGVDAAWGEDQLIAFSGTSSAAPFVSGALAGILSEHESRTANEAIEILRQNTNDSGVIGKDPIFGDGIIDIDRVIKRNTPGLYDAALADIVVGENSAGAPQVTVTVQNRGTEPLGNVVLYFQDGGQKRPYYLGFMPVGQVKQHEIQINTFKLSSPQGLTVRAWTEIEGKDDARPSNDNQASLIYKAGP